MIPQEKPRLSSTELKEKITPFQIDRTKYPLLIIGIRGYDLDTMDKLE